MMHPKFSASARVRCNQCHESRKQIAHTILVANLGTLRCIISHSLVVNCISGRKFNIDDRFAHMLILSLYLFLSQTLPEGCFQPFAATKSVCCVNWLTFA